MSSSLDFTAHEKTIMQERMIQEDWEKHRLRPGYDRRKAGWRKNYLKQIPQNAGKFLRVIVNPSIRPPRVITVFFDKESSAMKVTVDKEADALYMRLSDTRIHDSEEVKPGVILDYDEQNNLVGIEILRISERVLSASLKTVMIESA